MGSIFKYAVLQAVPDPRRGERVNIGLIVFLNDRVDVRISELGKVRALSGGNWDEYTTDVRSRLIADYSPQEEQTAFLARFSLLESVIRFSEVWTFQIGSAASFDLTVTEIMKSLVLKVRSFERPRTTRINTEIARSFKQTQMLAKSDESVEDHKVVRDYCINVEEDLRADFVAKNGIWHVTATLDLRRTNADKGQAAIKAIVLDKAKNAFADVMRYGVYAAAPGSTLFRGHVSLLNDYADKTFNWLDPNDRRAYTREIQEALLGPTFELKN